MEIARNISFYFINSIFPSIVISVFVTLIANFVRYFDHASFYQSVSSVPLWVKIVIGLLISDFGAYWGHRWTHANATLWRFHALHHAPDHMDWLINTRAHPADIIFIRLCGLAPLYIIGIASPYTASAAATVPILISLIGTIWSFFVHANVRWRMWGLEYIIATPAFHHWHHTNDSFRDHNFAALFPWIDKIFGTFHLPRAWPEIYGVDEALPRSMIMQLLYPWWRSPRHGHISPQEQPMVSERRD